jgi:predicted AAA+ superfamily ATPase
MNKINKEEILEILGDWNFWKKELESGKNRESFVKSCLLFMKANVITSIIGVRRSGKSYIMR